ncbi:MAG: IPExxxVDY family protein [Bacteroidales bacterium]
MTKKYYLEASDEWDFQMIGISTAMKDFRLAYYLNKMVYLELGRSEDLPAEIPGVKKPCSFSFYCWEEKGTDLCFYLIANRSVDVFLIPEQKQADYFLVLKGGFSQESLTRIIKTIRQIPNVGTAFKINIRSDKKIDTFLSEMELHTVRINKLGKAARQSL